MTASPPEEGTCPGKSPPSSPASPGPFPAEATRLSPLQPEPWPVPASGITPSPGRLLKQGIFFSSFAPHQVRSTKRRGTKAPRTEPARAPSGCSQAPEARGREVPGQRESSLPVLPGPEEQQAEKSSRANPERQKAVAGAGREEARAAASRRRDPPRHSRLRLQGVHPSHVVTRDVAFVSRGERLGLPPLSCPGERRGSRELALPVLAQPRRPLGFEPEAGV